MAQLSRRPTLGHWVQAIGAWLILGLFRLLPLDLASTIGGWLGRTIGPCLAINGRARRNIALALPELSAAEIDRVIRGMWDNLGRVVAEYPHLHELRCYEGDRIEVVGVENIDLLLTDNIGGIIFSGHLGNWEIGGLSTSQRGLPVAQAYRAPNNPLIDRMIFRIRERSIDGARFPKGVQGGRQLARYIREGGHMGILVDQKFNEGIPVPFFGRDAMTMTAMASFALKYGCPVIPGRVERRTGARFRITLFPPMEIISTGDRDADIAATMRRVNEYLEGWIRDAPEQWLWLHRRWPD